MVDFNSEATTTTPPQNILKLMALERFNYVLDALEAYKRLDYKKVQAHPYEVKARLYTLSALLEGMLKRELLPKDYLLMKKRFASDSFKEIEEGFVELCVYLDKKNLTRIDTKKSYDSRMVVVEDEQKQL